MSVLDNIKKLPPDVKRKIEEDIESAEFDDKRLGGKDDNPVVADFVILNDASHKAVVSIGRGRKFLITVSKQGADLSIHYRFENHHRSRGWTLKSDVIVLNEEGDIFAQDSWRAGIKEKDYGSYKVRETSRTINGGDGEAFAILVICYRDPSLRFKKILDKLLEEVKEEIIEVIVDEIKSWFSSDDDDRDQDKAAKKRGPLKESSFLERSEEINYKGRDGEDVATLAKTGDQ